MNPLRWKKSYSWLLLAALILPLLAACGGTTTPPAASPAASAPASTAASTPAESTAPSAAASESAAPSAAASESPAASGSPSAEGGKILRVLEGAYPDVFDPQKSSFSSEIAVLSLNYEGLTKLDADLKAVPAAAEKWEFNNTGDVITFTLRDNLKYSDGSPLTSANFQYAVERTCDSQTAGEYQSILFEIVGCQEFAETPMTDTAKYEAARDNLLKNGAITPDEKTIVLKLTNPAPYYTFIAGLWVMYPAKQELIKQGGEDWWKKAEYQLGNGPFQIKTINEDQLIEFRTNPNYWEGKPKLDGIDFVYQTDSAVALQAYQSGQVDIMQPDPSQLPAIKGDAALNKELLTYGSASTFGMGFNNKKEPFNDPKVRQAFAYAIDRQTYCEVIRNGDCIPAYSWIPKGVTGALEDEKFKFDPEKAKQALAESTYGSADKLPPIKISYASSDPAQQPRVEWVAGQLRDNLGINVTLDPVDTKALTAARKSVDTYPQVCFMCNNWYQDYPDPQNWLSLYWRCDGLATRVGYCNPQFDEITKKADTTLDEAERIKLYQQAGEILVDDEPGNFNYHLANVFLVKPEVTGYKPTVSDSEIPGQWGSLLTLDVNR